MILEVSSNLNDSVIQLYPFHFFTNVIAMSMLDVIEEIKLNRPAGFKLRILEVSLATDCIWSQAAGKYFHLVNSFKKIENVEIVTYNERLLQKC